MKNLVDQLIIYDNELKETDTIDLMLSLTNVADST